MGEGDTFLNAVIGGVVTVVLSFTGFSPLIGGAVAGYLQEETRKSGATAGALSGALAFIPFLFVLFLFFAFFLAGPLTNGGVGLPGSVELILLFVIFPLALFWNVGLGAVGGYLGAYVREEHGPLNG